MRNGKIYGEMNYVTYQNSKVDKFARRYTTCAIYRGSALNLFARGVDGVSLFNWDYVPSKKRQGMVPCLKGISDVDYLKTVSKCYAVYPFFGSFKEPDEATVELVIPDDTSKIAFDRAVLRVETRTKCDDIRIGAWLNGKQLEEREHEGVELFPPIAENAGYATRDVVKFYAVSLDAIVPGGNTIELKNLDKEKRSCKFFSVEIGLYR